MRILKISVKKSVAFLLLTAITGYTASAQKNITLSDPQIASVAVTANQIDVDYGKIALKKTHNDAVRKFAQTMVNDHTGVIAQAVALAKQLHVTPEDNPVTQQLLQGAVQTKKDLNSATGQAFDQAYVNNEVAYHQAVISAVNQVLIPQAKNQQLKGLLQKVAPVLEEHLKHAQTLQSELNK